MNTGSPKGLEVVEKINLLFKSNSVCILFWKPEVTNSFLLRCLKCTLLGDLENSLLKLRAVSENNIMLLVRIIPLHLTTRQKENN